MMINAELYETSNPLAMRDAMKCLDEYGKKLEWKSSGDRVLDIGCGGGGVTNMFKNNYMPPEYSKLVGCDISENMVQFANEHYADRRTEFLLLDIQGKLPEALRGSFDHVVSFNVFHWIKEQETAFRNIRELLADGGDCLILFFANMPIFDVYRILSQHAKWSEWVKDVDRLITPCQDSQDPVRETTNLLNNIGFKDIEVTCKQNEYVFDEKTWKNIITSVDPFGIPEERMEAFLEDTTEEMRKINKKCNIVDKGYITFSYRSLIIYAKK